MYKDRAKQKEKTLARVRKHRALQKGVTGGVTEVLAQAELHGVRPERMKSIVNHYDPKKVTIALRGYDQPNRMYNAP